MICIKCGKDKRETDFFMDKNHERMDICKSCLTMHIDNRKPDTFKWILKKFDIPYVERIWIQMTNKMYLKNPASFGPQSVIGKYIRTMNMHQWRGYNYADSVTLNQETQNLQRQAKKRRKEIGEEAEDYNEKLKEQYEKGEISEAEYLTLRTDGDDVVKSNVEFNSEIKDAEEIAANRDDSADLLENVSNEEFLDIPDMPNISDDSADTENQFIPDAAQVNEDKIREELTADDITYLSLKWGLLYKPSEWVELERLYQKYAADYELSVDREQSLKAICKTDLKMNQAIDVGDVKTFKDLQAANDSLRKSAKFTDAQKQEQKKRELDSIGELVAFVEQKGGIIPMKDDPIDAPQDKIDFIIKDLKKYTSNLVKNELGLGNLIESFIEKTKENKAKSAEDIMKQGISDEENVVTQEDAEQFQQFQLEEREEEAKRLAEEYGTE